MNDSNGIKTLYWLCVMEAVVIFISHTELCIYEFTERKQWKLQERGAT